MDTTTAAHPPNVGEIVEGMRAKLVRENPTIGARRKLHNLLTQEAEDAYKMQRYDAALVAWAKLLAVIESHTKLVWRAWLWGEGVDDNEHRASCLANIGAALHQRGDGQEAIAYYEQVPSRSHRTATRQAAPAFPTAEAARSGLALLIGPVICAMRRRSRLSTRWERAA